MSSSALKSSYSIREIVNICCISTYFRPQEYWYGQGSGREAVVYVAGRGRPAVNGVAAPGAVLRATLGPRNGYVSRERDLKVAFIPGSGMGTKNKLTCNRMDLYIYVPELLLREIDHHRHWPFGTGLPQESTWMLKFDLFDHDFQIT